MSNEWCTIESDPGVFTELLESIGVKNVELDELWSMDDDTLSTLSAEGPVYGLIFLFKWKQGTSTQSGNRTPLDVAPENLFFAHQVTTNACATQALLSVVLNAPLDDSLGTTLTEFRNFTGSLPPDLKGEVIGSSEDIKKAHNAFARKDGILDGRTVIPTGDEDVFHFVAYVPFQGKVYELDGLQKGPILIGDIVEEGNNSSSVAWMSVARSAIQERMQALQGEIKFNLMAVIQDRRVGIKQQMEILSEESSEKEELEAKLAHQNMKRHDWKIENQRRRHNYIPLCIELLKELAQAGQLPTLVTEATERVQAKRAKKQG